MHLKLRDQQLKMIMYTHRLLHTNLMAATNPKIIDTCTEKIKEFKHQIIKDSHQITRQENKRRKEQKWTTTTPTKQFTAATNTHLSITTLNVNGQTIVIKRQSSCTDEKTRPIYTYAAHKRLTSALKIHTLKGRGGKKVLGENGNPKKAEVAILRAEKIDFQTKTVIRNKEGINPRNNPSYSVGTR